MKAWKNYKMFIDFTTLYPVNVWKRLSLRFCMQFYASTIDKWHVLSETFVRLNSLWAEGVTV